MSVCVVIFRLPSLVPIVTPLIDMNSFSFIHTQKRTQTNRNKTCVCVSICRPFSLFFSYYFLFSPRLFKGHLVTSRWRRAAGGVGTCKGKIGKGEGEGKRKEKRRRTDARANERVKEKKERKAVN